METRIVDLHFSPTVWVYLHLSFSGGLRKSNFFQRVHYFGHLRSSKVVDIGTNRKRGCYFLLVRHSNLVMSCIVSEISQVFVLMIQPLFHPNLGVLSRGVKYLYIQGGPKKLHAVFQCLW